MWRSLAMRAGEVHDVMTRPGQGHRLDAASQHMRAAGQAHLSLPHKAQEEAAPAVHAWASALCSAVCAGVAQWVGSLRAVAMVRAAKLEADACRARQRFWREAVGVRIPNQVAGG